MLINQIGRICNRMTRVLRVLGWLVPVSLSTDVLEAWSRVQARRTGGGASVNRGRSQRPFVPKSRLKWTC